MDSIKWTGWHGPVNCRHYQKPHKMKMFTKMLNKLSFIHWCGSAGYDTDPDPWFALGAIWIKITAAAKILILAFSWIFSFRFSRNFSLFSCKCCNKQIQKNSNFGISKNTTSELVEYLLDFANKLIARCFIVVICPKTLCNFQKSNETLKVHSFFAILRALRKYFDFVFFRNH